jgi:hypothetical protein
MTTDAKEYPFVQSAADAARFIRAQMDQIDAILGRLPSFTFGEVQAHIEREYPALLPVQFEDGYASTTIRCAAAAPRDLRKWVHDHKPAGWLIVWEIWP